MSQLKQAKFFAVEPMPDKTGSLRRACHFNSETVIEATVSEDPAPQAGLGWWWKLAGLTVMAIVLLSLWQWGQAVVLSWQQSPLYGALLSAISLAILTLVFALCVREIRLWRRLQRNKTWQLSAIRISNSVQYGEADKLCQAIASSLPASANVQSAVTDWRKAVKDEHSDEERLALFQRLVLVQLDKQAQQHIYRAATDTSLAVAISPFALADMLLVLWRSSRLLRQLAQLYGGSMGQLRSLVMLKRLLAALLWAGGSEMALDMASDAMGSELTASLSARAGQGLIAGLLVARIGNLAQQQLRPLPADESARVSIKALAKALLKRFSEKTQTKADSVS